MTVNSGTALFGVLLVLAMIPGVSVLTVVARTASHGLGHGVSTTMGIVSGDIIFIVIAISGLALLTAISDSLLLLVKYLGAAYLFWLGIELFKNRPRTAPVSLVAEPSYFSSFLAGLLITLADQKAILFYLVFFPAFIDLSVLSLKEVCIIIALAATAIGIAKMFYACVVDRVKFVATGKLYNLIKPLAGILLIIVGTLLLLK